MGNINRQKAFKIYKKYNGLIKIIEIAQELKVNVNTIYSWKKRDDWDKKIKIKVGAPHGNKNAVGNKGGGAPKGNLNGYRHGLYLTDKTMLPSKRELLRIVLKQIRIIKNQTLEIEKLKSEIQELKKV